jgi:4-carboxymuconolactone decarboxylase
MSRLPYLRHDDLDPEQQAVWEAVVSTRGARTIHEQGYLIGPFNALLHARGSGLRVAELGASLRFHTSLDSRLLEIAVLTVAARWRAEYEWYSHARLATELGVPDEVIRAIAERREPPFGSDAERTVHAVARQLADDGQIDEASFAQAHELLGDQGIAELVFLCGYYTLVSFGLNAFDIPLPEGATPQWPR